MSETYLKKVHGVINITYGEYNGYVYFFHEDGTYSRFSRLTCELEYYANTQQYWPGWPASWRYPEATCSWDSQYLYFLRGSEYARYDMAKNSMDDGVPWSLPQYWSGWPSHWLGRTDAGVYWGYYLPQKRKKAFFFRDDEYLRYDVTDDRVDPNYPAKIQGNWPGWPAHWRRVEGAVDWGNGKAYFFSGEEYLRYDKLRDSVDPGYPRPLQDFLKEHKDKLAQEATSLFMETQVPAGARPAFVTAVRTFAKMMGIRPNWLMASMWTESGFNPHVGAPNGPYVGLHQMSMPLIYNMWGRLAMPLKDPSTFHGQPFEQLKTNKAALAKLGAEYANLEFNQIHQVGAWLGSALGTQQVKCRSYDQLRLMGFGGAGFGKEDRTLLDPVVAQGNPRYDLDGDKKIDLAEFREAVFDLIYERFKQQPTVDSELRHSLG